MGDKARRERSSFAGAGIPVGTTLLFKQKPDVAVVTADGTNRVRYEGAEVAISTLATKLNGYPSNGFDFFYLDGVRVSKLCKGAEKSPVRVTSEDVAAPQADSGNDAGPVPDAVASPASGDDIDPLAGGKQDEFDF
jgi:hypothetical protein